MPWAALLDGDPAIIGRFRLAGRLGVGGMGVVYLGETDDGQLVAVKVLRPELADNNEFRLRFRREVSTLMRVDGVCTVHVLAADVEAHPPFLVTEYIDGPSLADHLSESGPFHRDALFALALGLAEALTAIHAAGVVHRDLKPSNVLLSATGPKVIDFGIAQALNMASITLSGMLVGSPAYMAPEQIHGTAGAPADLFAWGLTLANASSGQAPFGTGPAEAIVYRVLHEQPDLSGLPSDLLPVVTAALAKDPADRPSAPELLKQLVTLKDGATDEPAAFGRHTETLLAQTWHPPPRTSRPRPEALGAVPAAAPPGWSSTPQAWDSRQQARTPASQAWSSPQQAPGAPQQEWSSPQQAVVTPQQEWSSAPQAPSQTPAGWNQTPPSGTTPLAFGPPGSMPPPPPKGRTNARRTASIVVITLVVAIAAGAGVGVGLVASRSHPPTAHGSTGQPTTSAGGAAANSPGTSGATNAPPAPSTSPSASPGDPATTVQAYFAAINSKDYQTAWNLGGKNLGQSYQSFVAGFSTTATDTPTILSVDGDIVTAQLAAHQTDGTVKNYQGAYTVQDGVITHFRVHQTG